MLFTNISGAYFFNVRAFFNTSDGLVKILNLKRVVKNIRGKPIIDQNPKINDIKKTTSIVMLTINSKYLVASTPKLEVKFRTFIWISCSTSGICRIDVRPFKNKKIITTRADVGKVNPDVELM